MSMLSSAPAELGRIARFGAVGLLNTVVGYAALIAALFAGLGDIGANLLGFAVGLATGFVLNSRWTFDTGNALTGDRLVRYLAAFAVAYLVNLAVVLAARTVLGPENPLSHLAGLTVYIGIFYAISRTYVFAPERGDDWLTARWPEAATAFGLAVGMVLLHDISIGHDNIWWLWVGRQLLGGAGLYTDIMEVNPPLWFWLAVPVQWAAEAFGLLPRQAVVVVFGMLAAVSLALLAALVQDRPIRERAFILLGSLAAMLLLPLAVFGQREHLVLIAVIPYVALTARRAQGERSAVPLSLAVGILAALGFALKHYFLVAPVLLEIWLVARLGRRWRPFRPETAALAVLAIAYAVAVIRFAPEFFSVIVPQVALAYHGYQTLLIGQILSAWVVIWIIAGIALWMKRRELPALSAGLAVAAAGFVVSYFAQQKGWPYHALPATALSFLAVLTAYADEMRGWRFATRFPYAAGAVVTPLLIALLHGPYWNENDSVVREAMADLPDASTVAAFSVNPSRIWPMIEETGHVWPSRHFAFWMVPAIVWDRESGSANADLAAFADQIQAGTLADFRCNPPDMIVVTSAESTPSIAWTDFDFVAFFRENPGMAAFLDDYAATELEHYTLLRRQAPKPAAPSGCRAVRS